MSLLVALVATVSFAQRDGTKFERVEALRKEFFEQELQLSVEESNAFWPIYTAYKREERDLKKSYRSDRKIELMSDAEAERYVYDHLEMEEKQLALKRKYIEELKAAISIRKIANINRVERKFKRELLQKIKDRRGGNNMRQRG